MLGRYLLLHPVAVVAGFYPERIEMWHGPSQAARSLAAIDGVRGRNGYAIESAPGHPGLSRWPCRGRAPSDRPT